jgi:hypothetical protein
MQHTVEKNLKTHKQIQHKKNEKEDTKENENLKKDRKEKLRNIK